MHKSNNLFKYIGSTLYCMNNVHFYIHNTFPLHARCNLREYTSLWLKSQINFKRAQIDGRSPGTLTSPRWAVLNDYALLCSALNTNDVRRPFARAVHQSPAPPCCQRENTVGKEITGAMKMEEDGGSSSLGLGLHHLAEEMDTRHG